MDNKTSNKSIWIDEDTGKVIPGFGEDVHDLITESTTPEDDEREWNEAVEHDMAYARGEVKNEMYHYAVNLDGTITEDVVMAYVHESYEEAVAREISESENYDIMDTPIE